jgi:SAM-dependent methyltransferase
VDSFERLLREAAATPVAGWDFARLGDRISTKPRPWDFKRIVEEHARRAPDLLDMGTGGGEWLASLSYRPPRTVATEAWHPNLDLAGGRLRPLGVTVVWYESARDNAEQTPDDQPGRLPFPSASFDLVTNRHETFLAREVVRVLTPGGTFLTQQTGGNYDEFYDALALARPERSSKEWTLALASEQLRRAGLQIVDGAEDEEETTFTDIGALAWYLRAIPWLIAGFFIDCHRSRLRRLHERIEAEGPLTLRQPTFWLKAVKPNAPARPRQPGDSYSVRCAGRSVAG